jgi:hypothetical protein
LTAMKTDENGWNDCAHVFHTSSVKCRAFRKWNDFWNDLRELPAKRPFQVERLAQGDPTLGVSLGTDSTSFRSTSSPIGELWNGSTTHFDLGPEARCLRATGRARCGRRVCVPPGDESRREKIEAGRLPRTRISVTSDKRVSR